MLKPLIGITTYEINKKGRYTLPAEYVMAVRDAGGIPVLLPPGEEFLRQLLEPLDGFIFAGGGDIDPHWYGGNNHPAITQVSRERDKFEFGLAKQVFQMAMPVLGICRGQQLLNVATGGTLIEHLPDRVGEEVVHQGAGEEGVVHPVEITRDSRLADILGVEPLETVSKHHQAVDVIPAEWRIVARAPDGVVEALEHRSHPWMIAVQWHPELSLSETRHLNLFKALVEEARKRRA